MTAVKSLAQIAYEADVDAYWRIMGGPRIEPNWEGLGPLRRAVRTRTVEALEQEIRRRCATARPATTATEEPHR